MQFVGVGAERPVLLVESRLLGESWRIVRTECPERSLSDITEVDLAPGPRPALGTQVTLLVDGHPRLRVAHLSVQHGAARVRTDQLLSLSIHSLLLARLGLNVARTWEPLSSSESSTARAAQEVRKAAEDSRVTAF